MNFRESPVVFSCAGEQVLGIVAKPEEAVNAGVLFLVGGPQYRVGSHRQFLLLSRALAENGYSTMRFDYRGMGDATGNPRSFETVGNDIGAALDAFQATCPGLKRIVLWGLCDAASASLLYCDDTHDARICGLVLLNPWVRSENTLARAHIKHYYRHRLIQPEFWRKLVSGQLGILTAITGFVRSLRQARQTGGGANVKKAVSFQDRMIRGIEWFPGPTLLVLSGNDYTAKEFIEAVNGSAAWAKALSRKTFIRKDIPDADHTFSTRNWRGEVEAVTVQWLGENVKQ